MNGTSRLYRSTSERVLGGVAAGLGSYLNVDPTIIRVLFAVLTLFSSGAFALVYGALWLLLPTAASTSGDLNGIIHENLNDMGARFQGMVGMQGGAGRNTGTTPQVNNPAPAQAQIPQTVAATQTRQANGPAVLPMVLIALGVLMLLSNSGFFTVMHLHNWWPLVFIGGGYFMLQRRSR